ncbi:SusC/RagA family TonB-linked outer membrane protein [Dyadobacter aurulentus]|uniref:SusC/RagA family TonB-linked outer membrane protein n=1 Tax=Dyadobacter sp. UC 10 TaxID=2605428 RepID=UPI0011F1056B|nr:SusC/RagA family TonB-linked outer membrane protein [Dyadobacter sp. UC 10]KAA0991195.1 SusC/RagA family TonB-linked outer membrane protein [Dyadobacter sp. UC 10]
MKKIKLYYFKLFACLLLLVHAFPVTVLAQNEIPVKGKVTDKQAQTGLPGVNVVVKGTEKGVSTDVDGNFTINATKESVLVFSFIGYDKQEVTVGNQTVIDVILQPSLTNLEELVVVGYGTMKKSDLTGAVMRVNKEAYQNQSMTQLTDMLTGTVAGFYANQSTSAAGGGSLEIRGPKSLNASTEPMIVLDGVIFNGSIRDINPSDIETIDILKDASSTAVFGARAAAGVLMITTKKGSKGKTTINFSSELGITEVANDFKPFDANTYLDFRRDILRVTNSANPEYYYFNPQKLPAGVTVDQWRKASANPQPDNTDEWLGRLRLFPTELENYKAGKAVDWYNKVMRPGFRQNYDLSIAGGSDKFNYYYSLGYTNNEGVIIGDKFSALRTRLNVDFTVTDWLNVGVNTQFSDRDESAVPADLSGMFNSSPYGSEFDANGNVNWYPHDYPGGINPLINYYGQDKYRKINSLFASMFAKVKLPFGIDYKISYQPRFQFLKDYNFWSSQTIVGGNDHSKGYGTRQESSNYEFILDNLLHWNKQFGKHSFDVTLLYSTEKNRKWYTQISNEIFVPNQNLGFNGLQYGTNPALMNGDSIITGDAVMARLNYTFNDKYLFTGSVRRDGYSAFGIKNPRAVFPAAALAWRISEEEFFQLDWVSQMKLRVSWGVNGNREIGAYSALAQMQQNLYYDGTNVQVGVYNSTLANHDLVWERTQSVNIGADLSLFKNKIDFSAEYYDMTTTNLLMNRLLPQLTGFQSVTSNLGRLGNRGFEMTVNTVNMNRSKLSWRSSFVFSLNRNKIKELFGDYETVEIDGKQVTRELPDYSNEWFPGQAIDRVWNYNVTGVWQTAEKDAAAVYRMEPGDFKAEDVNNNGVYEALSDKKFIGWERPRFRLGLRNDVNFLKYFTASLFVRADLGHIGSFAEALHRGSETYDRRNTWAIPYWTPDNPINDYARLNVNENAFGGGVMIYKPRSFVRIQDLSLGYNLPSGIAEKIRLNNARLFASVRNLYTFDKWPGWDPESGYRPMPRTYTFGVSVSL